jgi:proteasome lid subunit RPN8/RPN11
LGVLNTVKEVRIMKNSDGDSPHSFSIDPQELLAAYSDAEAEGLDVVGIFHSHPGRPSPSSTDVKFMEINGVVWLIYSTTERSFGAYFLDSGRIDQVKIE